MAGKSVKSLLVAALSGFILLISFPVVGQEKHEEKGKADKHEKKKGFDANEVIFGHVLDAYEFHFLSYKGSDGKDHHVTIPLPVIIYSVDRGKLSVFSSSRFHHGHEAYDGYRQVKNKIVSETPGERFYDISLTRNVVQMFLALLILVLVLISIAKRYQRGEGVKTAPTGFQNAVEPVITFIRDEVAKPNLGKKYKKYMPYLLTIFFFILINNIFGLIPGSANVTGNIAFTLVLGLISFVVILISSNSHFWAHIFNPPVPGGVKPIMIPVEVLGIFTKPVALIVRLFANMIAGHIIIICLISLIFIFGALSKGVGWAFSPISIAFTVFIYFIEILVAFLQAYIFTNLTAVFIGQAFEGGHDDVDHHQDAVVV